MGLTNLRLFLGRHRRVALDTSVFIYQLEANMRYVDLTMLVFQWLEQPNHSAITSTITMTELLVPAYRGQDESQVDEFYALLTTYENLDWIAPNLEAADIAARLRAKYRLRMPDAIQAATAIQGLATGLVTNDPIFRRVDGFETMVLDTLL